MGVGEEQETYKHGSLERFKDNSFSRAIMFRAARFVVFRSHSCIDEGFCCSDSQSLCRGASKIILEKQH